jgi:enoyl-CoA hydratase/carnithine racemase
MATLNSAASLVTAVIDNIAIVRLDRPSQRNSLSISTLRELKHTVSHLLSRSEISALIFTGTEDVFAAGADLSELSQLDPQSAEEFARLGQEVFKVIADSRVPTVAAINGYCMGGGLDLALSCDIRVSSRSAVLAHPGARRGIITGWGGTQRLPRLIGRARALEMFVTARPISSDEALEMGLVSSVGDPVLDCALDVARLALRWHH